ncbi:hypothetical protein Poli38472_005163 [Pythium oligandrum]|uniref:Uncharacterized protein n=1 Tax=Pythium oligandrum TaxID=41045 RepID=A0A8K1CG27_PYTOL|nr:hypothetical protein Poli38472_005163 [Pythium oligandrum]|eukprot:TMW62545.1 hypothetical protein Poli38472_005163 [Pythium oligandrum]
MSLFAAMSDENSVWAKGSSLFNISSPLNDLLETDSFTLEQILQEDELIQEVKTRNTKLLEFLSQDQVVQKLVEYVVRTPEEGSDDLRALKYPYMSCEVICCDISSITETLACANDGKIVETLFEFLYQPTPLDPRLAGYFEKIMSMLMVRKPQEMTALMNKNTDKLLKGFVAHAQSFSIAELFKRLLQPYHNDYMDDMMDFPGMSLGFPPSNSWYGMGHDDDDASVGTPTSSTQKSLSWQQDKVVIDLLLANLTPTDTEGKPLDSDVHKHSADVLVDVIHCGTRAQQNDPASPASMSAPTSYALLEYLETKDVVEKILNLAVPPADATFVASSMTSALSVLSALLSRHTNARYSTTDELPATVASTLERLPQLCSTLRAEDHDAGTIRNQRYQTVPRLGLRRLKLVGLVVLLMQTKFQKVDAALLEQDAINICLDLFFKFESVNMLHADVESMIVGILESGGPDLLKGLIKNARLLERIVEAHEKNEEAVKQPKGFSYGFVGHLHRICNMIISLTEDVRGEGVEERQSLNDMTHADSVLEMLEEDKEVWKKWDELATKVLAPIYERERLPLGGSSNSVSGDDPYSVIGGFNPNEAILNEKFAEMLGSSAFDPQEDFDIKNSNDTPMLPDMHDSSSSSDEEEDRHGEKGEGWSNFEGGASWANFEHAANAFASSFDPNASFANFDDAPDSPPAVMEFVNDNEATSNVSSEGDAEETEASTGAEPVAEAAKPADEAEPAEEAAPTEAAKPAEE